MQEPKPKPAPQPVPQLSRAPARPAPPVTEAAQLPKAAAPSDSAPGRIPSDRIASRNTKPAAPRTATDSVLPLEFRKASARPAGQAAETSPASSPAARVEETPTALPDSAIESKPLPQLRQAPLRPRPQAADPADAAAQPPDPVEQSSAQAEDPAIVNSPLPQTSLPPEGVQKADEIADALVVQAIRESAAAAERGLAQPDQAASAAPVVAPEPLPTPQRPNKPKTPPATAETGSGPATLQGAEASRSTASSTPALERSEAAPPAAGAQQASAKALPEALELLEPSQAQGTLATPPETAEATARASAKPGAPTRPQEVGAAMEILPRAPPMALPKPALPAAQPDQTGRVSLRLSR